MSTNLFFSQPAAQNLPTGIRSDKMGPSGSDRSARIQTFHESPKGDRDHFLTTLKQVTRDRVPTKRPEPTVESRLNKPTAGVGGSKIDGSSDHEAAQVGTSTQTGQDEQPDPMTTEWNLAALTKLLESMGFRNATETSDLPNMVDANPADNDLITAIESLIARLQQHQFGLTADLKAGLADLQQFVTTALRPADGVFGQGLWPSQVSDLAQINQWLNGLTAGLQAQGENFGLLSGEGTTGVNSCGAIAAQAAGSAETMVNSLTLNGSSPGTVTSQSTEHSAVLPQSENRSEADPKLSSDSQAAVAKINHDSKAAPAAENAAAQAHKTKEQMGSGSDPQHASRTVVSGRITTAPDPDKAGMRDAASVKSRASTGPDPAAVKMSESQIQSASGAEPLSKVFQETQLVKGGIVMVASGATEEAVGKVINTEAGSNDNGLLNSAGHSMGKAAEPATVQKEIKADQSDLRNQTLDQIVRKAAIHLRNGQHEARIELKPDFLGHIRMQVISASHQVTVKILAEHGFVKDMIESNIHQLKADLQQQGLEVDKLEVTVSRDSEDSGNYKDKLAQSKTRSNNGDWQNEDPPAKEKKRENTAPVRTADGAATVDYFA
jgi:flagellar hook-length control protein FliK